MFERQNQFLGGRWVDAVGDPTLTVVCPATEEVVGRVPVATQAEVDQAVTSGRAAFDSGPWPRMTVSERASYLRRLVAELEARREPAVELQIDEMGGTRQFTNANFNAIGPFLEQMLRDSEQVQFREVRQGSLGKVVVLREPVGVTAAITPWNAPMMVVLSKLLPSLLMGCPIVIKPAPESPLSPYVLAEAVAAAGIPEGVVSIVNGGAEVGAYLVGHAGIDTVTFTGSAAGGRAIARTCGALLRPVTLELGGKSPALVLEGVDMTGYVPSLVDASLRNSGQMCISTNRVIVHESQRDELAQQLVDHVASLKVGDPYAEDTYFGPLAAERQRASAERFIASGLSEGAKVVLGGGRPADQPKGWFVEPTIFVNVDNHMQIAQEEIFGPVLSIISYATVDEGIAIANDSVYGLGGAVYAPDVERGLEVAGRITTGTCSVNGGPSSGGGGPFGGRKQSGLGRERSVEGLQSFLELKSVALPVGYEPSEVA